MTEAKISAGVMVVQDILYIYQLLELIGLGIRLPMLLNMDNSRAVDIAIRGSVGG